MPLMSTERCPSYPLSFNIVYTVFYCFSPTHKCTISQHRLVERLRTARPRIVHSKYFFIFILWFSFFFCCSFDRMVELSIFRLKLLWHSWVISYLCGAVVLHFFSVWKWKAGGWSQSSRRTILFLTLFLSLSLYALCPSYQSLHHRFFWFSLLLLLPHLATLLTLWIKKTGEKTVQLKRACCFLSRMQQLQFRSFNCGRVKKPLAPTHKRRSENVPYSIWS